MTPSIGELLESHERALVTYATRLIGDVGLAQDVVQDTFLKLISQGEVVRDQPPEALAGWLFTTCRNRALDVLKREKRMRSRELAVAAETEDRYAPGPGDPLEKSETDGTVRQLLAELPESQQEALRLRFQHGLSYRQIAEVMGQSLGHVGFLLHKGMNRLRNQMLQAEHGGARS